MDDGFFIIGVALCAVVGLMVIVITLFNLGVIASYYLITGVNNPYTIQEAQECDALLTDVIDKPDYFISNNLYYSKDIYSIVGSKRKLLSYDYYYFATDSVCNGFGESWVGYECYGKEYFCVGKK